MLTRRLLLAGMIAGVCFLSACHKKPAAPEAPSAAAIAKAQAGTSHPAWLHAHLPAGAVGYLRIPSPWTMVGATPTGTALDSAAVNARQLAVVAQLRKAAAQQPELADTNVGALIGIFFARLASPLEATLIDPTGMPTPNARMLIAMQLDVPDASAVQAMFAGVPQPALHLTAPLDGQGDGQLGMGARVHFDAASKRLFLLAGMRPPAEDDLGKLLASLKSGASAAPSMAAMEPRIDASGQGLFVWFKLKGLAGLAASRLPPDLAGSLPADLAEHTDAIALGMGTVHGHGRLSILLHAPGARLFGYLAPKLDFTGLEASGTPRWAFTMALPAHDAVQKFDGQLQLELGPKGAATWQALGTKLQSLGVPDLTTLTGMFGPEWVVFGDDQGSFSALRLRDAKAFHAQLAKLTKEHHWQTGVGTSGDAKVHWLSAPGFGMPKKGAGASVPDANAKAMLTVLQRLRTRLYWMEEGNWLVFANVPQALADRAAAKHTKISDWFVAQDYAPSTWLGVTAVSHDAQRDAYYHYIRALVTLGDLLDQPVDIMALPSAAALHLPDEGQIGMALDMRDDAFALKVDYAQLPTELIQGHGGMSAVAVTAILAAIAIPAYQDYVIRAQVSEGLTLADGAKAAVAEFHAERDRLPRTNTEVGLPSAASISGAYVGSVSIEDGVIHVVYGAPPQHKTNRQLAGKSLLLTPQVSAKTVTWVCSSPDITPKYLPNACRPSPQSQVPAR